MSLWSDSGYPGAAFSCVRNGPAHLEAVARLKEWTRARFTLAEDEVILVTEMAPSLPGCPPLVTVVAFWTADGTRHQFKVFKRAEEVLESDVPPAWLKAALAASDGIACACC
jgi:hypothetical protein